MLLLIFQNSIYKIHDIVNRAGLSGFVKYTGKDYFMINKLFFQPDQGWAGDPIPFFNKKDGRFYLFYLFDQRLTHRTAYKTSWNLAVSSDLVNWEDMGTVLFPGNRSDPDLCCYTGSVIHGKDDVYHMFYTAQNPDNEDYCISGKPVQYIIHAVSTDLLHWEKHPESAFTSPSEDYEPFDWRDPHVFEDPNTGEYCMLLAARYKNSTFRKGGLTLICRSTDLLTWSAPVPFYSPEMYYTHECPDIFFMNGWWYLVFSTFTQRFATHYRMSRSLKGPWLIPDQDTFDARGLYAIKTAAFGKRRFCFGWIPTKENNSDFAYWQWGGTLAIHELIQDSDGCLHVKIPDEYLRFCTKINTFPYPCLIPPESFAQNRNAFLKANETRYLLYDDMPETGILTADLFPSENILDFGLFLHVDDSLENGYYFRFDPLHRQVVYDYWPRNPLTNEQHRLNGDIPFQNGFERWLSDSDFTHIHLELLCCGTVMVLYVNNKIALSARINRLHQHWGFFATRGVLKVEHIWWREF